VTREPLSWQRRAARLGWVAIGLGALSPLLIALDVWVMASDHPPLVPPRADVSLLPVDVPVHAPRLVMVLVLGLTSGAVFAERPSNGAGTTRLSSDIMGR
jgi:hypothetical protein